MWDVLPESMAREARDWLDDVLKNIHVTSRYALRGREIVSVSVPRLTSVDSCLVYALAVVLTDRHEFRGRVRKCGYKTASCPHFFLDAGSFGEKLPGAPRRFCCDAHANRHRQAQHRQRQKDKHK